MDKEENNNQECCPLLNPADWDGKELKWEGKKFIKGKVFTLFNIPINFGSAMKKLVGQIEQAGMKMQDGMVLSDHTSKWNMDIYLAVDKEVEDAENATLSGKYVCKVYEGPFQDTGKWCNDFSNYVNDNRKKLKKMYMWYTTCPKCAKKFGKNYVVIVGEVE